MTDLNGEPAISSTKVQTRSKSSKQDTTHNVEKGNMEDRLEAFLRDYRRPRLPAYDPKKLDLWFIRVETEFAALGIEDDDTRYFAVLRAIDGPTTEEITDVLNHPPVQDKYSFLKNTIIERLGVTKKEKLRLVLKGISLGTQKPSQLLRLMKNMAAGILPDDALHELWVEKLPTELRAFLAMSDDLQLDQLAKLADRIMPEITQTNTVMAVSPGNRNDISSSLLSAMLSRLDNLEKTMADLLVQLKSLKTSQHGNRSHSRGRSSSRSSTGDLCFYHRKFGDNARRCTTPCSRSSPNQENDNRCRQ